MMSSRQVFEAAKKSIKERQGVILEISKKFNYKKTEIYANNFKNWILENMPESLARDSLHWSDLYPDERKKLSRKMVFFLASYKNAESNIKGVNFKKNDGTNQETWAAVGDRTITLYSALWDGDSFDNLIGAIAHEVAHKFQDLYQTTLHKDIVELANKNYIDAEKDMDFYELNPVEKEAIIIEQTVAENFLKELKSRQDFY